MLGENGRRWPGGNPGKPFAARRSGDGWRGRPHRAAPVRHRHGSAVMKRSPFSSIRIAPSPRKASVASGAGSRPMAMAVGWNWTNSGSAIRAPARAAMPRPSPRASEWIGGDGIKRAEPAGGEDHRPGAEQDQPRVGAAALAGEQAHDPAIFHRQFDGMKAFQDPDRRRGQRPRRQGAGNLRSGPVALHMDDAGAGMRRFAPQRQPALSVAVEGRAQSPPDRRCGPGLRAPPDRQYRDRKGRRRPRSCRRHGRASHRLRPPPRRCRPAPRRWSRTGRGAIRPAPGPG